jgi:murein DD-endopeptidase MepM/ murein hydrolase activator NlpD
LFNCFREIIAVGTLLPLLISNPGCNDRQQKKGAGAVVSSQKQKVDPNGPEVDCAQYTAQPTSPYILPYQVGESFEVWRTTSHYTPGNRGVGLYAIDFQMPIGTKIVAARAGVVVAARGEFYDGNGEDLKENFVFIKHDDGSVARYFHLTHDGALVKAGDQVKQGDVIGLSGNTGQTTGPHLHFDVQKCGPNLPPNYNQLPCGQTLPVTFRNTKPHACGLVPGESYKAERFD